MPELPEVETTRRGIEPHIVGKPLDTVTVRNESLRWPVPKAQLTCLDGAVVSAVERRAKYLLLRFEAEPTLLLHLGMSGSLRVVSPETKPEKHDHIDLVFDDVVIRFNDPRRFGCCLLLPNDTNQHKLLSNLGPEPLSDDFDGEHLFLSSRKRSVAVKNYIMNSHVVVGVGNIYASESLYLAGIRPTVRAGKISRAKYERLAASIKTVLSNAIKAGGTTLSDFTQADGKPGYFAQKLQVYGRIGEPCFDCNTKIKQLTLGQRSSFYCPNCQK